MLRDQGTEIPVDGPLLLEVNKGGRILASGISGAAVYDVFRDRAVEAGVQRCTPHDGRRTFAGTLYDAAVDTPTVQRLMGHSRADTTSKYDRRGERAKVDAVGRLHMPWTESR